MKKRPWRAVRLILAGIAVGVILVFAVQGITASPSYTPARAAQAFMQTGRQMAAGTLGCQVSLIRLGGIWRQARKHRGFVAFNAILRKHNFGPLFIRRDQFSVEYSYRRCMEINARRASLRLLNVLPGG